MILSIISLNISLKHLLSSSECSKTLLIPFILFSMPDNKTIIKDYNKIYFDNNKYYNSNILHNNRSQRKRPMTPTNVYIANYNT